MQQVKVLLSMSALIGLGLLSACSRNQVEPEDPSADPSLGTPPGTVVVDPVVIEPAPTTNPTTGVPVVVTPTPVPGVPSSTGTHVVQPGEGLYGIARQYNLDYRQLAAWNNIFPPYTLQPGQQLVLSGGNSVAPTPIVTPSPVVTPTPAPVYNVPSTPSTGGMQYHTVQPGENLYRIAKSYGLNYQDVAQQNGIPYPYSVSVGQRISLYMGSNASSPPAPRSNYSHSSGYHVVASQETLYSLSRRYGYSVQQLATWNGLYPPYTLKIGQSLRVSP